MNRDLFKLLICHVGNVLMQKIVNVVFWASVSFGDF